MTDRLPVIAVLAVVVLAGCDYGKSTSAPTTTTPPSRQGVTTITVGREATVSDLDVAPDGRWVVGGAATPGDGQGDGDSDLVIARLTRGRRLDRSFAGDGVAVIRSTSGSVAAVAVQDDGKVVFAGSEEGRAVVGRVDRSGLLDFSFGPDGRRHPAGLPAGFEISGIHVMEGRVLVVAGRAPRYRVIRLGLDGTLDRSFGDAGTLDLPHAASAEVAPHPRGGFMLVVEEPTSMDDAVVPGVRVSRYSGLGVPDPSYGDEGAVRVDGRFSLAAVLDGGVVAGRLASPGGGPPYRMVRISPDGRSIEVDRQGSQAGTYPGPAAALGDGRMLVVSNERGGGGGFFLHDDIRSESAPQFRSAFPAGVEFVDAVHPDEDGWVYAGTAEEEGRVSIVVGRVRAPVSPDRSWRTADQPP